MTGPAQTDISNVFFVSAFFCVFMLFLFFGGEILFDVKKVFLNYSYLKVGTTSPQHLADDTLYDIIFRRKINDLRKINEFAPQNRETRPNMSNVA